MRRLAGRLGAMAVVLSAATAGGEISAELRPLPSDAQLAPYQPARLAVRNKTSRLVTGVRLRAQRGGPTMQMEMVLPPGEQQERTVPLPAVALEQVYRVCVRGAGESAWQPVRAATVRWPAEQVHPAAFVDPRLYARHERSYPDWPAEVRRNVLMLGVLLALGLAATLLIRPPGVRIVAAVIVIAAASVAAWTVVRSASLVVELHRPLPREEGRFLAVLGARRSTEWSLPAASLPVPVYYATEQMAEEPAVIHLDPPRRMQVPLHPQEVRPFRRKAAAGPISKQ
ncbi:MAG: hypothetical protein ACOC93_04670 [Planctomycetota bacterium]